MGIDEAGRGCVIGPLVMAAVLVCPKGEKKLQEIGVRDSKKLSPKRREELFLKIEEIALEYHSYMASPRIIDEYCTKKSLNILETEKIIDFIKKYRPDKVYIDALSSRPDRFACRLKDNLSELKIEIIAENKADDKYAIVGAASIIAKVLRDKSIQKLHKKLGNFGSGYPSDKKTQNFLRETYQKKKTFPTSVRKSWGTVQRILQEQMSLFE